jgi:hypothetical protein
MIYILNLAKFIQTNQIFLKLFHIIKKTILKLAFFFTPEP